MSICKAPSTLKHWTKRPIVLTLNMQFLLSTLSRPYAAVSFACLCA